MFNKTTFCLAFCSVQSSITPLSLAGLHSSPAVLHQTPLICVTSVPIRSVETPFQSYVPYPISNMLQVTRSGLFETNLFSTSLGRPLAFNSQCALTPFDLL